MEGEAQSHNQREFRGEDFIDDDTLIARVASPRATTLFVLIVDYYWFGNETRGRVAYPPIMHCC